jgi:uncharacterized protein with FMN-binding domain
VNRALPALAAAGAAALPVGSAWGAALTTPKPKTTVVTKIWTGPSVDMRWGPVGVTVKIRTTTTVKGARRTIARRLVDISATYPTERDRSAFINEQAVPYLRAEVLRAQSANIDLISGATMTSEAYAQSLQAVLAQAKFTKAATTAAAAKI